MLSNASIYVKNTLNHGKGLFANRDITKGEVVYVVTGTTTTYPTIFTIPIDWDLYLDDQSFGQYLCHSCEPNCGIQNRTSVVAMKDIKKDEEIAVDYAMFVYDYKDEMTEENRVCMCGKFTCRGKLGCFKELPQSLKDSYKGYISDFLFKDKVSSSGGSIGRRS